MGQVGPARSEGTDLFYLHHHHAHHTPPDAHSLTAEVVLVKEQVDEGVADEAERLWDRAVEVVGGELQVHQASEVRANAVRDGTLSGGRERRGHGRRRAGEDGWGAGAGKAGESKGAGGGRERGRGMDGGWVKSNGSSSLTRALLCNSSGPRHHLSPSDAVAREAWARPSHRSEGTDLFYLHHHAHPPHATRRTLTHR